MSSVSLKQQPSAPARTLLLTPLILSALIIAIDQITKLIVVSKIPYVHTTPDSIIKVIGDFLWFIYVSNEGAMFSIGSDFTGLVRIVTLFLLPVLLLLFLLQIIVYSSWNIRLRWVASGIVGGGVGNMVDRFFRPEGVVDFISVNVYGAFGMSRWPTFNIADVCIVVSMIFWILFIFYNPEHKKKKYEDHTIIQR